MGKNKPGSFLENEPRKKESFQAKNIQGPQFQSSTREKDSFPAKNPIDFNRQSDLGNFGQNVPFFDIGSDFSDLVPKQKEPEQFPRIVGSGVGMATRPDFPSTQNISFAARPPVIESYGRPEPSQNDPGIFARKENLDSSKPDFFGQKRGKPEVSVGRRSYPKTKQTLKKDKQTFLLGQYFLSIFLKLYHYHKNVPISTTKQSLE